MGIIHLNDILGKSISKKTHYDLNKKQKTHY